MIDFFDRFDKYMKHKGLNDNKVTVEAGLSVGSIGKQRKGSRGLSSQSIAKLLCTYNDLDAEWLLTGKGEMLKGEAKEPVFAVKPATSPDETSVLLLRRVEELSVENHELKQQISQLAKEKKTKKPVTYGMAAEPKLKGFKKK